MNTKYHRNKKGDSVAELAAALVVVLPIIIAALFVFVEVSEYYVVKDALGQCAQTAARKLAIDYGQDPDNTIAHPEYVFMTITYPNIVTSYTQFSVVGGWNVGGTTPAVTVQVTFTPGANGAPTLLDPLHLATNTTISSTATCFLE